MNLEASGGYQISDSESITNSREKLVDLLEENYLDLKTPLKIKKVELLKSVGLPVSKSEYFDASEIDNVGKAIDSRLGDGEESFMIRFACDPDKFSMPSLQVQKGEDVPKCLDDLHKLVRENYQIKKIILSSLTTKEQAKNKISGRLMLEASNALPTQSILELYKGARTNDVLNNPDTDDPNFLFLIKQLGGKLRLAEPKQSEGRRISEGEVEAISSSLQEYEDKMAIAREVIAKSRGKFSDNLPIIFEFSSTDGELVFSDIDY